MDQETENVYRDDAAEDEESSASVGPKFAADGTVLQETQAPRSGLSLGGRSSGPLPPPPGLGTSPRLASPSQPLPEIDPKALLQDGAKRAKNITTALAMVVLLLAKYLAVKVVGSKLKTVQSKSIVIGARLLQALYIVGKPHFDRLKVQAKETSNKLVRIALLTLIALLTPLENATLATVRSAKAHSAKLAAQGVRTTVQVIRPIAQALAQAVKAGFQKATVQKIVLRLIQILEEAQK